MGKTAFLFAGQGSQKQGMGKEFYEAYPSFRKTMEQMEAKCPHSLCSLCFETEQSELDRTALASIELAEARLLESFGIQADYAMGLSLGEYSALAYAGAIADEDLAALTAARGQLMEDALPAETGGMMAVMTKDVSAVLSVCEQAKAQGLVCEAANFNSPMQTVLSGSEEGLAFAKEQLKSAGIRRLIPLQVSGPFHSSFLEEASGTLRKILDDTDLSAPRRPVIFNVSGKEEDIQDPDACRALLERQLHSPVLADQSLDRLLALGCDRFVEIGPGKVLSKLISKKAPEAKVFSLETLEDLETIRGEWNA